MSAPTDPDVHLLQALADPIRLSIVRQLSACDSVCACDFEATDVVSQPTVSHHLKVLREAGIVDAERRGTWIHYSLRPEVSARLRALAESLTPTLTLPATAIRGTRLPVTQPAGS